MKGFTINMDIALKILTILAPIFIVVSIGFSWNKLGRPFEAAFLSRLLMEVGVPCLVLSSLIKADVKQEDIGNIAIAVMIMLIVMSSIGFLLSYLLKVNPRVYVTPFTFTNAANLPLPLCLYAFGAEGLALGMAYYVIATCLHFVFGVGYFSGETDYKKLLRTPIIHAGWIAAVFIYFDLELPIWIFNTLQMVGGMVIPIMLITLGVSLSSIKANNIRKPLIFSIVRVTMGITMGLLITHFLGYDGVTRGAILIQSAMPSAVVNFMIAKRYNKEPETVAAMVVSSTLISLSILPFVLWLVL